jgi:hypothetical protein
MSGLRFIFPRKQVRESDGEKSSGRKCKLALTGPGGENGLNDAPQSIELDGLGDEAIHAGFAAADAVGIKDGSG